MCAEDFGLEVLTVLRLSFSRSAFADNELTFYVLQYNVLKRKENDREI